MDARGDTRRLAANTGGRARAVRPYRAQRADALGTRGARRGGVAATARRRRGPDDCGAGLRQPGAVAAVDRSDRRKAPADQRAECVHRDAGAGARADRGEGNCSGGREPGADQRAVLAERRGARLARRAGPHADALRARGDRGCLRGAAFQRGIEQDVIQLVQERAGVDEKETKRGFREGAGDNADESPEANAVAEDSERIDADVSKLAADLGELQRMLVRRQADFDNYRKRIEKERSDDSRRATARVIEGLIPVLDGFEQALAAHKEPAYEGFRK